ncbi:hypothetical protein SAMN04487911_105160 [Arenibacter nanhaiticus]|uniref:Very-short-patch-repair endonuclease n=1 Tax=Arenibacter nanhaiticus TaxID=558155 RepID=A0A1M6DWC3_9FLAO|nr:MULTISPECIES: hypothetical protein [Arenibacter]NKI25187.1 hypothetical protein [Arenibacter sp. 6A1]SHI77536.1 hypothetical protein SAMN04487911_105160 [Arenibacter nanhaiticus]
MTCLECKKALSYIDHRNAMDTLGLELCSRHKGRIEKLIKLKRTPKEAILLYYGLKEVGIHPTLEWWDGKKSVDISISRVKLNIEIDTAYNLITHDQAIQNLEEAMHSFRNGFTTIRIPHILIKHYLKETVANIKGISESLKTNTKTI